MAEFQATKVPVHSYLGQLRPLKGGQCRMAGGELRGVPKVKGHHPTRADMTLDFRIAFQYLVASSLFGFFQWISPDLFFISFYFKKND